MIYDGKAMFMQMGQCIIIYDAMKRTELSHNDRFWIQVRVLHYNFFFSKMRIDDAEQNAVKKTKLKSDQFIYGIFGKFENFDEI